MVRLKQTNKKKKKKEKKITEFPSETGLLGTGSSGFFISLATY